MAICEQCLGAYLFVVLLQIKVRTKKKEDDDNEEEGTSSAVICEECGRSDRRHRLLVCIHCDSGYGIQYTVLSGGILVFNVYFIPVFSLVIAVALY